ncbi:Manganese-transporting ATPase 13A1 [Pelomyxa schiedti]|nr:Manganese-transporting ATPase 13A1 [Pelomyxa schiedti]
MHSDVAEGHSGAEIATPKLELGGAGARRDGDDGARVGVAAGAGVGEGAGGGGIVEGVRLYRRRGSLARLNVGPFVALYGAAVAVAVSLLMGYYGGDGAAAVAVVGGEGAGNGSDAASVELGNYEGEGEVEGGNASGVPDYGTNLSDIANGTTSDEVKIAGGYLPVEVIISLSPIIAVMLLHAGFHLAMYWSVRIRCWIAYTPIKLPQPSAELMGAKVPSLSSLGVTHVKVDPVIHKGLVELCPIVHVSPDSSAPIPRLSEFPFSCETEDPGDWSCYFVYQKTKFYFHPRLCTFQALRQPIDLPVGTYLSHPGHTSQSHLAAATEKHGKNHFDFPVRGFFELYKEQALAPFFVFQVFCVGLWCLDEYPQYALFMLVLLMVFEATVVKSRMRNLATLRDMVNKPPQNLNTLRFGKWTPISSDQLIPGDIISVVRGSTKAPFVMPCDAVILSGSCVLNEAMLTGESTPHLKESINTLPPATPLSLVHHKQHILFGGTTVVQHMGPPQKHQSTASFSRPVDGGCVACVLRTGFETSQGSLMRTILYGCERVTVDTGGSALIFIAFLLVFAIAAAGYVLHKGLEENRNRYKLLLNCTLILTSVVPPELPMELSLAVNTSLLALKRLGVFCTEPFRIPFAGAVDVCCFDKTGTLTSDELVFQGVVGCCKGKHPEPKKGEDNLEAKKEVEDTNENIDGGLLTPPNEMGFPSLYVLAGCHSLVRVEKQIVGDPLEVAALSGIGWSVKNDVATPLPEKKSHISGVSVTVTHRFPFTSQLKRMSTIITVEDKSGHHHQQSTWVVSKGAPEVMKLLFVPETLPPNYDNLYRYHARQGTRVLALGYHKISSNSGIGQTSLSSARETIETGFEFAGFALFACSLKPHTRSTITKLRKSSHKVVMITGDSTLTSCYVAHDVGIARHTILVLTRQEGSGELEWVSVDEIVRIPATPEALKNVGKGKYNLCVSGETFTAFSDTPHLRLLLPRVRVFARVSPEQKEAAITMLNALGTVTLMCGDGVNDVGGLKQAHVGVALLAPSTQTQKAATSSPTAATQSPNTSPQSSHRTSTKKLNTPASPTLTPAERYRQQLMAEIAEADAPLVQLGDASIASPFTCKSTSVSPVCHIVKQGRCTLVTTLQMYKILAMNCLISAYTLSVLYIDGVKLGDFQAMVIGMLIAFCFLFISRSQPLEELSKQRPIKTLFHPVIPVSVFLQFVVHFVCLVLSLHIARASTITFPWDTAPVEPGVIPPHPSPDSVFQPNLVNTAVFLVSCAMQLATFAVNYEGHPFMQSLTENKGLLFCLAALGGITIFSALELSPDWNKYFQLVPLPTPAHRWSLVCIMLSDCIFSFLADWLARLIFTRNNTRLN